VDDPAFLPVLYGAAPEDDWKAEATWRKAMPALGDFCSLDFIRDECKDAVALPANENRFRQLYLNQWTEQAVRWLSADRWAACGTLSEDPRALDGRECYAGLDLGVTGDMSALALCFPDDDGGYSVRMRFWAPAEGRWRNEPRNEDLYRRWHREGWLTFTDGEATDFDQVEREILEANDRHPFRALFADRAFATHMLSRLYNHHGLAVKGIPQGP
jgi:phage terminase large subunit-like protein